MLYLIKTKLFTAIFIWFLQVILNVKTKRLKIFRSAEEPYSRYSTMKISLESCVTSNLYRVKLLLYMIDILNILIQCHSKFIKFVTFISHYYPEGHVGETLKDLNYSLLSNEEKWRHRNHGGKNTEGHCQTTSCRTKDFKYNYKGLLSSPFLADNISVHIRKLQKVF